MSDIRLLQYQISYHGINSTPTGKNFVSYLLTCREERYAIWYYDKKRIIFPIQYSLDR